MSELFNTDAEALVLAAMVRYPEEYWSINSVGLTPSDFVGPENRRVMKAIAAVAQEKKTPEYPLVLEEIRLAGHDSTPDYLAKLNEVPCSVAQSHEHVSLVKGLSVSRNLANAGAKIIEIARDKRSDFEAAITEADTVLYKVKANLPPEERGASASDILARMATQTQAPTIPIRFLPTLQRITLGYEAGMFWVIGGFSSVGKSAFAVNMALDGLRAQKAVSIVSLEMTQETYMRRFLSTITGIPQTTLRDGLTLPFDDNGALEKAKSSLSRSRLQIIDTKHRLDAILGYAKKTKETIGLDILVVDFIQNVQAGGDEFSDARNVALQLQQAAKELSCTVIAFSQVSNEMAKRDADGGSDNYYSFKGHGAIRDAADVGIMLRRDRQAHSPVLNVNVVKNRHGELANIQAHMELETGRIDEYDGEHEE